MVLGLSAVLKVLALVCFLAASIPPLPYSGSLLAFGLALLTLSELVP